MKKILLLAFAASLASADVGAQIVFTPGSFFPTSVNNEGVVVGSNQAFTPLQLWNPDAGTFQEIGGKSSGNNAGGSARFVGDGNTLVGCSYNEHYLLPATWQRTNLGMEGYTIGSIMKMPRMNVRILL